MKSLSVVNSLSMVAYLVSKAVTLSISVCKSVWLALLLKSIFDLKRKINILCQQLF